MPHYGVTHLVVLGLFAVGLVVVVLLGRRHRAIDHPTWFSRTWALLIPAVAVPLQLFDFARNFDIDVTLPLHLSDFAWIAAAFALWTHHRFPVALTYYWGLVLTTQAIITPSLGEDFPEPRYFAFWWIHLLVVWAAVYLVFGLAKPPGWRDYAATILTTFVWAVTTFAFNVVADTNYGYLMRKPATSILDLLGPWPWYVVAEIAIIAAVWALLTVLAKSLTAPSRGNRRPRERSLRS